MSLSLFAFKNSLHFKKWPLPRKPLYAENGEGWGDSKTKCFDLLISDPFFEADLPHNIKTNLSE